VASLSVFPVPANDVLNVSFQTSTNEAMQLVIYNAMGQVVMTQNVFSNVGKSQMDISVADLAAGVYQLEIVKGAARSATKFVKQ
jgi:hypothetical protein